MQRKFNISNSQVVFSQWSRKGYAIFASLNKVVKIGQLKIEICKEAVKKSLNLITDIFLANTDDKDSEDFTEGILSELLLHNLIAEDINAAQPEPQSKNKLYIYPQSPCFAHAIHGLFN